VLALCACSLYADTGGSSAVGSAVRGVGLGSGHRRSVAPHGSPPGHRAPAPHILSNSCTSFARRFGHWFTITINHFLISASRRVRTAYARRVRDRLRLLDRRVRW